MVTVPPPVILSVAPCPKVIPVSELMVVRLEVLIPPAVASAMVSVSPDLAVIETVWSECNVIVLGNDKVSLTVVTAPPLRLSVPLADPARLLNASVPV